MATLAELTVKVIGNVDQFNKAMTSAQKTAQDKFSKIQALGNKLALGMGAASVALGMVAKNVVDTAVNFEVMNTRLKMVYGSTEIATQKFKEFQDISKAAMNVSTTQLIDAAAVMNKMKEGSERLIPALAGMADEMNIGMVMAASQVARAMAGDTRAFLVLERQMGITKVKLKAFDAAFDETGKNAKKNGEILEKYIEKEYGKKLIESAGTMKSAIGTLTMTIDELKNEIGKYMIPILKFFADKLVVVLEIFKNMPEPVKKVVAGFLLFAPPLLAIGAASIFVAGSLASLMTSIGGLITAEAVAATTTGLLATAQTALGLASGALSGIIGILSTTITWNTIVNTAGAIGDAIRTASLTVLSVAAWAATVAFTALGTAMIAVAPFAIAVAAIIAVGYALKKLADEYMKTAKIKEKFVQDEAKANQAQAQSYKKHEKEIAMTKKETAEAILFAQQKIKTAQIMGNKAHEDAAKKTKQELRNRLAHWDDYLAKLKVKANAARKIIEATMQYAPIVEQFNEQIRVLENRADLDQSSIADQKELVRLYTAQAGQYQAMLIPLQNKIRDMKVELIILGSSAAKEKERKELIKKIEKAEGDLLTAKQKTHDFEKKAHDENMSMEDKLGEKRKSKAAEQHNSAMSYLEDLKAQNQISAEDELKYMQRALAGHNLTAETRKEIQRKVWSLESQLRQKDIAETKKTESEKRKEAEKTADKRISEEKKVTKKAIAEARKVAKEQERLRKKAEKEREQAAEKRKQLSEQITDAIQKNTLSEHDYELLQLRKRIDAYREGGVEEIKIRQYVEGEKARLLKQFTEEQQGEIAKTSEGLTDLQSQLDSFKKAREGGVASPIMSMEEMAAQVSAGFATPGATATTGRPTPTPTLPTTESLMAGTTQPAGMAGMGIGDGFKAQAMSRIGEIKKEGGTTINYNTNVAGIRLEGEKGKEFRNNLVSILDVDGSETMETGTLQGMGEDL